MAKFKVGDKVVRNFTSSDPRMIVGETYTVSGVNGYYFISVEGIGNTWKADYFDLAPFDLKEPWYIKIDDEEHSKQVQDWLFSKGCGWFSTLGRNYLNIGRTVSLITNDGQGELQLYFSDDPTTYDDHEGFTEIKVNLRKVIHIDSITYRKNESLNEKRIRELEETIAKAQAEIADIKGELE